MQAFNIIYNQIKQLKQQSCNDERLNIIALIKTNKEIQELLK